MFKTKWSSKFQRLPFEVRMTRLVLRYIAPPSNRGLTYAESINLLLIPSKIQIEYKKHYRAALCEGL